MTDLKDPSDAVAGPPPVQALPDPFGKKEAAAGDESAAKKAAPPAFPIEDPETMAEEARRQRSRRVGRCELYAEIAHGGMAMIYLGRWRGAGGFAKPVAVKALHAQYAKDDDFKKMFLDEARVVARVRHPNVMATIDLVDEAGELFIVMDYVHGATLAHLTRQFEKRGEPIPLGIGLRIMVGVLHGLHAAHEATDEQGDPLGVIHRDVSPENIMVGVDGFPRLIDFGVASALGRLSSTRDGFVKGKMCYLAPEQVQGQKLTRQADIFAASIVLWQVLTGRKLFVAENVVEVAHKLLNLEIEPPSRVARGVPKKLDKIALQGLERYLTRRWPSAEEMADAIEAVGGLASQREVGQWVREVANKQLARNAVALKAMERTPVAEGDEEGSPQSVAPPITLEALDEQLGHEPSTEDAASEPSASELSRTDNKPAAYTPPKPQPFPKAITAGLGAAALIAFALWGVQRCAAESPDTAAGPAVATPTAVAVPLPSTDTPDDPTTTDSATAPRTAAAAPPTATADPGDASDPAVTIDAGAAADAGADGAAQAIPHYQGSGKLPDSNPGSFSPPGI